jgi:antitoxin component HigA of HigAB toxin-antitoxin module
MNALMRKRMLESLRAFIYESYGWKTEDLAEVQGMHSMACRAVAKRSLTCRLLARAFSLHRILGIVQERP